MISICPKYSQNTSSYQHHWTFVLYFFQRIISLKKNHYKKAASPSSLSNSSFSVTTSLLFHFGRSANTKVFKLRKASLNNVTFIVVVLMVLKYYTSCLESKKMESVRGVTCRSWPRHQWSHSGNNSKTGGLQASDFLLSCPPSFWSEIFDWFRNSLCSFSEKEKLTENPRPCLFLTKDLQEEELHYLLPHYLPSFSLLREKVEVLVFTDESISMLSILSAVPGSRTVHYLWALLPVCL